MKRGIKAHFTTARLVGAVTLALAILAQLAGAGSILLFAAAIAILLAPTKYCQEHFEKLAELDLKKLLITTLYESLFWVLFLIAGYAALWKLQGVSALVAETTVSGQQAMLNPAIATQNLANAQSLVWTFVAIVLFLFVVNIANSALSRSLIWSTLTDTKWNKEYYLSFLKLTAAWWSLWAIPFFVLAAALSKTPDVLSVAFIALTLFSAYFTFFVHTTFLHRKKVGASITHGIAQGIGKFYHLLVPLSFALIVYVIAYQALRAAQFLPPAAVQPIMIGFALVYLSWLRAYVYSTLPDFSEE